MINGKLSDDALSPVPGDLGGTVPLSKNTANAFMQMRAAARKEGSIAIVAVEPAGGYRSLFVQGDMKARPWLYRLSSQSTVKLAAPGFSTHGYGAAVDIAGWGGPRRQWLLTNMGRFGFSRPFGDKDENHLQHNGASFAALYHQPVPARKRSSMYRIVKDAKSDAVVIVGQGGKRATIQGPYHLTLLRRLDKSDDAQDPMLMAELDICKGYLTLVAPDIGAPTSLAPVLAKLEQVLAELPDEPDVVGTDSPTDLTPVLEAIAKVGVAVESIPKYTITPKE